MSEIGRGYLWSLLQLANRMADYLEDITPDQRDALALLAAAPRMVDDGWVPSKVVRDTLNLQGLASLGSTHLLDRGLIELAQRRGVYHYRITDAGIDLLARIEEREEKDEILQRIRREWRRTVAPRKKTPPAGGASAVEQSQIRGERLRAAVLTALASGPMRPKEIEQATGLTDRQVENQLTRLRAANRVHRFNGVYSLVRSQSREGAA